MGAEAPLLLQTAKLTSTRWVLTRLEELADELEQLGAC
jgi:hypothetical protein